MGNDRFVAANQDRDDIEARLQVGVTGVRQVPLGSAHNLALLVGADRLRRNAEGRSAPGLDLDEEQVLAVTGDDIEFTDGRAVIARIA